MTAQTLSFILTRRMFLPIKARTRVIQWMTSKRCSMLA